MIIKKSVEQTFIQNSPYSLKHRFFFSVHPVYTFRALHH